MNTISRLVTIWSAPEIISNLLVSLERAHVRIIELEREKADLEDVSSAVDDLDIPDLDDVELRLDQLEGNLGDLRDDFDHESRDSEDFEERLEDLEETTEKHGKAGDALALRVTALELRG